MPSFLRNPISLVRPVKLIELVADDLVERCVDTTIKAARTGKIGDGKIFVTSIERVIRIRTGEEDESAV